MAPRLAAAAALALAPPALWLVLATLADRDWRRCTGIDGTGLPSGLAQTAAFAGLIVLAVLPWMALAGAWLHRRPRGRVLAIWAVMVVALLWVMLPPWSLHDCDRKGSVAMLLPLTGFVPLWLALLAALMLTRPKAKAP